MFKPHNHCRACGLGRPAIPTLKHSAAAGPQATEQKLVEILDLGLMPLANDFVEPGQERAGYAPLVLRWCPRCTLGQLSVTVNPKVLYSNYSYVTSKSQTMLDHFSKLSEDLAGECGHDSVVEIGSNDGTLLEYFKNHGFSQVMGVEPASNLCDLATKRGIDTLNDFFNEDTAKNIQTHLRYPDLIIARHVFCHIDNWQSVIAGLELLCGVNSVIAIEVPYLLDTVKNVEWDQIYHEHLSYMTVKAMQAALSEFNLHVSTVKRYAIHGGAIVMLLRRNDSPIPPISIDNEILRVEDMKSFADKARSNMNELSIRVRSLVAQGKTVVGYGASAKATQWIHGCGFTRKEIKWVCDNTPQKQYKLMPGSDIPIVDPGALTRDLPDYAVNFSWNFHTEIESQEQIFKAKGGRWIIPHNEIKIV